MCVSSFLLKFSSSQLLVPILSFTQHSFHHFYFITLLVSLTFIGSTSFAFPPNNKQDPTPALSLSLVNLLLSLPHRVQLKPMTVLSFLLDFLYKAHLL